TDDHDVGVRLVFVDHVKAPERIASRRRVRKTVRFAVAELVVDLDVAAGRGVLNEVPDDDAVETLEVQDPLLGRGRARPKPVNPAVALHPLPPLQPDLARPPGDDPA